MHSRLLRTRFLLLTLVASALIGCGRQSNRPPRAIASQDEQQGWAYDTDREMPELQSEFDAIYRSWRGTSHRSSPLTEKVPADQMQEFGEFIHALERCKQFIDDASSILQDLAGRRGGVASRGATTRLT